MSFEFRVSSFEFRVSSFQLPASSFRVSSLKFRDPKRILRQNDLFIEHRTVTENNCIFARLCTGLHCLSNQVGCERLIQSLFHLRLSFVCCRIWKCSAVPVSVKRRLQTADCRPGVKCRLRVKCRLQTADQG